jgi:hypothetical protein
MELSHNHSENISATYRVSRNQRTVENSHIGHCTLTLWKVLLLGKSTRNLTWEISFYAPYILGTE